MAALHFKKTSATDPHFIDLVAQLDAYLAIQDGEDHAFYHQFNGIVTLQHVIVVYAAEQPVGCGAIKEYEPETAEIKRMFTLPHFRGKGIATLLLNELEDLARSLSYKRCVLETGIRQPEAIALYQKNGYQKIANYGQYTGVANSLCFEKIL